MEIEEDVDSDELIDDLNDDLEPDESRPQGRLDPRDAEVVSLKAQVEDLNVRLGNAVRVGGEKLKAYQDSVEDWIGNTAEWHESKLKEAYGKGFKQGAKKVEGVLLKQLSSEERADYILAREDDQEPVSPRSEQLPEFRPKVKVSDNPKDEVNTATKAFIAAGVRPDQLDHNSVEGAISSGVDAIVSGFKEQLKTLEAKVEGQLRDNSGASRVSRGGGAAPVPARPNKQLEDELAAVNKRLTELRKLRGRVDEASGLLRRKTEIERQLRR